MVSIRNSAGFREAPGLWRTVYEDEIRTPREIKRFVNELRYKAIRFRGPQPAAPVFGSGGQDASDAGSQREPALILFAIPDRLLRNADPEEARERLPAQYRETFDTHLKLFGEPSPEDRDRYHRLFGDEKTETTDAEQKPGGKAEALAPRYRNVDGWLLFTVISVTIGSS